MQVEAHMTVSKLNHAAFEDVTKSHEMIIDTGINVINKTLASFYARKACHDKKWQRFLNYFHTGK